MDGIKLMFYGFSMVPITSYRHFWTKPWATEFVFMASDEYLSKYSVAGDVVENQKKTYDKYAAFTSGWWFGTFFYMNFI